MNTCRYKCINLLNDLPFLRQILRYVKEYQYKRFILNTLVSKVEKCSLRNVNVENICWGSSTLITSEKYINLTLNLALIDLTLLNNRLRNNLIPSLHWSRRFEYPFIYHQCEVEKYTRLRILDVGAGLNPFQVLLSMLGHFVVSLDLDLKSIMKLCKIVSKFKGLKIYPCLADAFQISNTFKENFFDRVICISVIEHILDYLNPVFDLNLSYLILKALLCELVHVTKPGGKICITLDVDLSGRSHLNLNEVNILSRILDTKIPHLPQDVLISNKTALGSLFAHNKTVLAIILRKIQ
jgi:SAM-dependent methyltransferase